MSTLLAQQWNAPVGIARLPLNEIGRPGALAEALAAGPGKPWLGGGNGFPNRLPAGRGVRGADPVDEGADRVAHHRAAQVLAEVDVGEVGAEARNAGHPAGAGDRR